MATLNAVILRHQMKKDGTFNVKIRLTHKRQTRYLDTKQFVVRKQLDRDFNIKDIFVMKPIYDSIFKYRESIAALGDRVDYYNCENLLKYIQSEGKKVEIISFGRERVEALKSHGRDGTANNFRSAINHLIDYFGKEEIFIDEITSQMLRSYEAFLRKPRTLHRIHRNGTKFQIESKGLTDAGIACAMRDLRGLFNVARDTFNDEDLGLIRIKHYPFKKYKIKPAPETRKRNIDIDTIKKIRDFKPRIPDGIEAITRDLFMLSFYACGTNAIDIFHLKNQNLYNGRMEYNRMKTKDKRRDRAFISIKIIDEMKPILDKYVGTLHERFSTATGMNTALSQGFDKICTTLEIPRISFYWARHSFATIARNKCRKSKDDVALALNHVDEARKTTDIYIEKDWSILDEVQNAVVSLLRHDRRTDSRRQINLLSDITLSVCR
ncbi:tyrosine-type recombinase/integrase [Pedobacter terrae]|uniref:tyrosine-type recombinase/integrase n=1 Tax=Pedobacter terrae TaxID=405671 RepID=UPI002FFAE7CC